MSALGLFSKIGHLGQENGKLNAILDRQGSQKIVGAYLPNIKP